MIILVDNIVQNGSEDESEILELAFAAGYTNNYLHCNGSIVSNLIFFKGTLD